MRKNHYGRFLLCSVTDLDGRRHRLLFPEGNGLLNGWTMLEELYKIWDLRRIEEKEEN